MLEARKIVYWFIRYTRTEPCGKPQMEEKKKDHTRDGLENKNPPLNKCPLLLEKICLAVDGVASWSQKK